MISAASNAQPLRFTEVGVEAGARFYHQFEPEIPFGSGTAWADFDGDGHIDLLTTQSAGCNRLSLNNGDGTFAPPIFDLVLGACDLTTRGVTVADYDNDGDADVYLTAFGTNRLLENRRVPTGDLSFIDVTAEAGMMADGGGNSGSAVWGDYDRDGFLDLFVTNHTFLVPPPVCQPDLLWHNEGDGTFTELAQDLRIATSGDASVPGCGLAATWSDYDADGDLDLMIVNDFGYSYAPNRLFRNDGPHPSRPWHFTDVSLESGFDYQMYGMGIAKSDFDRDGDLDYYMADIGANNLALSDGEGSFVESAAAAGVVASDVQTYLGSGLVSWGVGFFDLDLDGWEDLVVANGGAPDEEFPGMFGFSYIDLNPVYLYHNNRTGSFSERHEPAGLQRDGYHRSFAAADFDDDGDIDLHFGTLTGPNSLYRNDQTTDRNWLKVRLTGTVGNRDAYGSRVQAFIGDISQMREVDGGSSFLARHDPTVHFGLNDRTKVDRLRVTFLSGLSMEFRDVDAGQTLEIIEPETTLELIGRSEKQLTVRLSHHHPERAEKLELWLESLDEDLVLYRSPLKTIRGGEPLTLEIPTLANLGSMRLRIGHFPDTVKHQIFID